MCKLSKSVFVFLLFFLSSVAYSYSEEQNKALQTAIVLNYMNVSLNKIVTYNDRVVLDNEYNDIINNINISKINDEEVIGLLRLLMTTLTEFTLNEEDRKRLQEAHNKKVSNSLKDSFSSVASSLLTTQNVNVSGLLFKTVIATGTTALNYERQLDSYRDELDSELWMLKKEEIRDINELRVYFLDASWKLMQKYNIPDEWRLTEEQINDFLSTLKLEDNTRALRILERMENQFHAYPPFWFYIGSIHGQLENYDEAYNDFKTYSLKRIGFLRNDNLYSSMLMQKLEIMEILGLELLMSDLADIVSHSSKDWQKVLYSSIKYWSLGDTESALKTIQINIDNGFEVSLNQRIKASILSTIDPVNYEKLVFNLIKDDHVKNNDILFLLGERSTVRIIEEFKEQILGIKVILSESTLTTKFYNRDKIKLILPYKWVYDGVNIEDISMHYNGDIFSQESIENSSDEENIIVEFKSPEVLKSILDDDKEFEILFNLPGINNGVLVSWILSSQEVEVEKNIKDNLVDKASSVVSKSNQLIGKITENSEVVDEKNEISDKKIIKIIRPEMKWILADDKCFMNEDGLLSLTRNACDAKKKST
jgi:hypothetical protein